MIENEKDLLNQLQALADTAPELTEAASTRWKKAVREMSQMEETRSPIRKKRMWPRVLASAAALVFLLGGTILSSDYMPRKLSDVHGTAAVTDSTPVSNSYYNEGSAVYSGFSGTARMAAQEDSVLYDYSADYDAYEYENSSSNVTSPQAAVVDTRKLIRTISMTMSSTDFDASNEAITSACAAVGGYISSSSLSSRSNSRTIYLTLRIPADRLDDFLANAGQAGRVSSRSENVDDVTDSYFDVQSRLESQQALLARMRELASQATDMEDLLEIESRMADTQAVIDSYTGTLRRMDNRVAYATVSITLNESIPRTTVEDRTLTFGERLMSALQSGWETFAGFCGDFVIFTVAMMPFILLIGLIVGVVVFIIRRRKGNR